MWSHQPGDDILSVKPPLFAVCQSEGKPYHGRAEVGDDLSLFSESLCLIQVASDTFEVSQSHLKCDPVRVVRARVLEKVLMVQAVDGEDTYYQ